jgi:hypothetical protein
MPLAPISPAAPVAVSAPAAAAPKPGFGAVLERHAARPAPPAPEPQRPPGVAALEGVERAQRRLDAVLASARSGRTFTAQELLGLQAEAYRFAQTIDLAAKLVEHGAQAVKQTINTPL